AGGCRVSEALGSFALVLHTHLPWLRGHGRWPVGEEWLHQAWTSSYLPLTALLDELADEGRGGVLTLGAAPLLAAQLDAPACLSATATWVGMWQARAAELGTRD